MEFETATAAMACIRKAKLGDVCIAVPNHPGWRIEQHGYKPCNVDQLERLERASGEPVVKAAPVAKRERPVNVVSPKPVKAAEGERKRATGAMAICREVFATCNADKASYVAECVKRGVFEGTAKARWTDLMRNK